MRSRRLHYRLQNGDVPLPHSTYLSYVFGAAPELFVVFSAVLVFALLG